ncbi:MAG: hypothetical protein J6I85_01325 [Clostridia bacterium]|nr:hypothetical protein [Clostridia bacterium]
MEKKKMFIIIGIVIVLVVGCIIGVLLLNNKPTSEEKEVIEIVNKLNAANGDERTLGDWSKSLHIDKVIEVKKVDINRLNSKYREGANAQDIVYMMNLQERSHGVIQVVIVNGAVTANSLTGETYDDLWNSDSFTKDKFNLDRINESIK